MAASLTIEHLTFQYADGNPPVLSNLSLTVPSHSCCAVLGPTGSGKTTLLHLIAGSLLKHHPSSIVRGSVVIDNVQYQPAPKEVLFPAVGLTLQDPYVQLSGIRETVHTEVALTLELLGTDTSNIDAQVERTLRELGLSELSHRQPNTLSGGETQRVALATIFVAHPSLLLMDEPATALDYGAQTKLISTLRHLKEKTTLLMTDTHIDFVLEVADRFVVLDKGTCVLSCSKEEFLNHLPKLGKLLPIEDWREVLRLRERRDPQTERVFKALGLA
jgi:energy-coupling factor transporter ATP-binding protein EcfA2